MTWTVDLEAGCLASLEPVELECWQLLAEEVAEEVVLEPGPLEAT